MAYFGVAVLIPLLYNGSTRHSDGTDASQRSPMSPERGMRCPSLI